MIESGSLTPGVFVERFELPPHTALRVELPAAPLTGLVRSYHVLDSDPVRHGDEYPWLLPTWPAIRFILTPHPIALSIGTQRYDPMPRAALYGNASKAMRMTTHGGVTVGIDLTPLGWSRLFRVRADLFRDRVVPLETMLPHGWVTSVFGRLLSSNQSTQVKPILDELLLAIMPPPGVDDAMIVAIQRFIAEDGTAPDLGAAAAALGLTPAALRRLSIRHFGFPPKTLLIRTRFIRSLVRMLLAGERADYTVMAPSYFDVSHFIRDANRFLGMTPRRFLQYDHRYLIACLRADQEVRRAALAQSGESRRYPATRPENAPLLL